MSNVRNTKCSCCEEQKTTNPIEWVRTIYHSAREVMRQKWSIILFVPIVLILWFLFITIPVFSIPSNTYAFQLSLYTVKDYVILSFLALVGSLFFLTQVYSFKKSRAQKKAGIALSGSVGGISGFFASIFGVASCPMCVASLFGFLGLGTVGFLVNYQWIIFAVSAFLVIVSLYFTARRVHTVCDSC